MIEELWSGGQTGADQGGLEAALEIKIPYGGWIPKGRITERGRLEAFPLLKETKEATYPPRTWRNVHDTDATVVFTYGIPERGSELTLKFAKDLSKPWAWVDFSGPQFTPMAIHYWIEENKIKRLNVAGNRESKSPGIQKKVKDFLVEMYLQSLEIT